MSKVKRGLKWNENIWKISKKKKGLLIDKSKKKGRFKKEKQII